jgi:hypothetical protein
MFCGMVLLANCTGSIFAAQTSAGRAHAPIAAALAKVQPAIPVARPVIALDIDETLCITDYSYLLWGIGSDDSAPLPGAQAALTHLAVSFDLVYVTARSRSLSGKTKRWLERYGFPKGRLVMSPTVGDFIFQSGFKRRALSRLKSEYPNLVVGIGDKAADAKAYRASGMFPVVVNPWPRQKYRADDVILSDWTAVSAFFEENLDVLSDPDRMNGSLGPGRVWVGLPGKDSPRQAGS